MPTVAEHLTAIYERLAEQDDAIAGLRDLIARPSGDPLQQEIDLDLPHASAADAALERAAGGEAIVETEVTDDSLTVRLPAASPEKQEARRHFAESILNLNETFPGLEGAPEGLTAVEAYVKGGPQWLYLGSKEGRDHILTLPAAWKQAMVEDIAEDSERAAREFARDVLKDTEPASGMAATYDYLLSTAE